MLTLRLATRDDARLVWEVNSHPSVREQSTRTDPIPWESHVVWFERTLAKETSLLLVGEDGPTPVGIVRFDQEGEGAVISVALRPEHRGRGWGAQIIALGTERAFSRGFGPVAVAYVRPSNEASRRAFLAAGYRPAGHVIKEGVELDRFEKTS